MTTSEATERQCNRAARWMDTQAFAGSCRQGEPSARMGPNRRGVQALGVAQSGTLSARSTDGVTRERLAAGARNIKAADARQAAFSPAAPGGRRAGKRARERSNREFIRGLRKCRDRSDDPPVRASICPVRASRQALV